MIGDAVRRVAGEAADHYRDCERTRVDEPGALQGNVLRGYKHLHYAVYLFCRIGDVEGARGLLARLLEQPGPESPLTVSTDEDWEEKSDVHDRLNVAFTYAGLDTLGWAPPFQRFEDFKQGMATRAREQLRDSGESDPDEWDPRLGGNGREGEDAHVLFTLYGDTQERRQECLDALGSELRASGVAESFRQLAQSTEAGGEDFGPREHFGFRDGFSQPAVPRRLHPTTDPAHHPEGEGARRTLAAFAALPSSPGWLGWRQIRAGEFVLGYRDEDGVIAGGEKDPHEVLRNGTFMVWRKLEQDVEGFHQLIEQLAPNAWEERYLEAKVIGRWQDGTSLIDAPYAPPPAPNAKRRPNNAFDYSEDGKGARCPIGAHVRRANPRASLHWWTERTRRHRIIRRGMPYDERGDEPPGARGLIFVCFNASIARQFELIQGHWLMDGDAFGLGSQQDFMLGYGGADAKMTIQGNRRHAAAYVPRPPRQLVITRGGYYLFVPGIEALRRIAAGPCASFA